MTTPSTVLTLPVVPQVKQGRWGNADGAVELDATVGPLVALRGSYEPSDVTSIIDAELRRIRVARRSGSRRIASERIERLIDYVWFDGPAGGAA